MVQLCERCYTGQIGTLFYTLWNSKGSTFRSIVSLSSVANHSPILGNVVNLSKNESYLLKFIGPNLFPKLVNSLASKIKTWIIHSFYFDPCFHLFLSTSVGSQGSSMFTSKFSSHNASQQRQIPPAKKTRTDFINYRLPSGKFYCSMCNMTINNETAMAHHVDSRKHRAAFAAKKTEEMAEEAAQT